jgi:hypothetical protein
MARHIRLNAVAVAAFKVLQQRSLNREGQFFVNIQGSPYEVTKIGLIGPSRKLAFGTSRGIVFGILLQQAGDAQAGRVPGTRTQGTSGCGKTGANAGFQWKR